MKSTLWHSLPIIATQKGVFRILMTVGSGKTAAILPYLRAVAHMILIVDVPRELDKLRRKLKHLDNCVFLPLAEGHTLETLIAKAISQDVNPEIREILSMVAGLDAQSGCGQARVVGILAALLMVKSAEFLKLARLLRDEAIIQTDGRPSGVELCVRGSIGGATASGAASIIADALVAFLSTLGVSIQVNFDLIDSTTFTGLGDRTHKNAAATISRLEQKYGLPNTNAQHPARVVYRIDLSALKPFRHEHALREACVAQDEQAFTCSELREHLDLVNPNHALNGPLGNFSFRTIDYFHWLDAEMEVAREVADKYYPVIAQVLANATSNRELVTRIDPDLNRTPIPRRSLEEILESTSTRTDAELLAAIETPAEYYEYLITAHSAEPGEYRLDLIHHHFLTPPATLSQAFARLRLLHTLETVITQEAEQLNSEIEDMEAKRQAVTQHVVKQLEQLRRGGWWSKPERALQRALAQAQSLRQIADECCQLQALATALRNSLVSIHEVLTIETKRLETLRDILDGFRSRGSCHALNYLLLRPLDEAFGELCQLASFDIPERVEILCAQVSFVTIEGLAKITDVPQPRLDLIAQKIVHGPPKIEGPYPGATRQQHGELIYVLPPLLPELKHELRRLLRALSPTATIANADYAAAGVNILRYRISRPQTREELFPGILEYELEQAKEPPFDRLYLPQHLAE